MSKFLKITIMAMFFTLAGAISMELSRDFIKSAVYFGKSKLKAVQSNQLVSIDADVRKIQSVNYPLLLSELDLSETKFEAGAGSLGVLCGALTVLDRTGVFYSIKNGCLSKLFSVDNGFPKFAMKYQYDGVDMLRAHNFTSSEDKLFVS